MEKSVGKILVPLTYRSKRGFQQFRMQGKVQFFTHVHRACTFSIACYDVFVYGTNSTKWSNPTCSWGFLYLTQGYLASGNERKLQFENINSNGDHPTCYSRISFLTAYMSGNVAELWHHPATLARNSKHRPLLLWVG